MVVQFASRLFRPHGEGGSTVPIRGVVSHERRFAGPSNSACLLSIWFLETGDL